jgi:hypothetical protein
MKANTTPLDRMLFRIDIARRRLRDRMLDELEDLADAVGTARTFLESEDDLVNPDLNTTDFTRMAAEYNQLAKLRSVYDDMAADDIYDTEYDEYAPDEDEDDEDAADEIGGAN